MMIHMIAVIGPRIQTLIWSTISREESPYRKMRKKTPTPKAKTTQAAILNRFSSLGDTGGCLDDVALHED